MSLIKKPEMTPRRLAANQANGPRSYGPVTPEGLERARDARIQHGFYARDPSEALEKLGEDREEFNQLVASMVVKWQPANDFETRLVKRLARALWKWERGDRQLESMSVQQLENLDANVDRLAAEAKARHEKKLASLTSLEYATREEDFCFTNEQLLMFDSVYGEVSKGRPADIFVLLYRLVKARPPKAPKDSPTGQPPTAPPDAPQGAPVAQNVAEKVAEEAGPDALPGIPVAEGREREAVRSEVRQLIKEEIEATKAARVQRGDELLQSTSPYYRDCIAAPTHKAAGLMLRMETSAFRQVVELTTLLTKLKAAEEQRASEGREGEGGRNEGRSHYIHENKRQ
jgi:hypothetical protein